MSGPALAATNCGLYGKLPAVGDFVRRGLEPAVAAKLQDWLQQGLAGLAGGDAQTRDETIDTAPSWRFVASAGVLGEAAMAGMLAPSRDRVGRRYPLIALVELTDSAAEAAAACSVWFDGLDRIVESAVTQGAGADEVFDALKALGPPVAPEQAQVNVRVMPTGVFVEADDEAFLPGLAVKALNQMVPMAPQSSLWWRRGRGGTRMLLVQGLPVDAAFHTLFVSDLPSAADPAAAAQAADRQSDVAEPDPEHFDTPEFDLSEFSLPDLDTDALRA
ncbi:MAG: type VI secretion system-associated protein TagF [Caulobacteraceae bacterium]